MNKEKCKKCTSCELSTTQDNLKYFGCFYGQYNGKWIEEFKECPKNENKEKILSFIKERSESELGTTKNLLYKEFNDISKKETDTAIKELMQEKLIMLCPLTNENTGMSSGRGYCTPEVF